MRGQPGLTSGLESHLQPPPPLFKTLHKGQRYCWPAEWLGSHDCSVFKFECLLSLEDFPLLHLGGKGYNCQYAKYCKESSNSTARGKLLTVKEIKLLVIFYSAFWLLNNSAWKTAWSWDTSGINLAQVHRWPALNLRVVTLAFSYSFALTFKDVFIICVWVSVGLWGFFKLKVAWDVAGT